MSLIRSVFILFLLLVSCKNSKPTSPFMQWQEIAGRDNQPQSGIIARYPLYRIKVPENWKRINPSTEISLSDTTLPIITYLFESPEGEIKLTIHHFPVSSSSPSIPTLAQIERWKKQFERLDPTKYQLTPQSFSGFVGWQFEGTGKIQGKPTTILAWALQLAPEHKATLYATGSPEEKRYIEQIKADVTLKFVATPEAMEKNRSTLVDVARSFELIPDLSGTP